MKILVFTASTGGGHNRVSNALKEYVNGLDDNSELFVVDAMEQVGKVFNFICVNGYKELVTKVPDIYGLMYKNADKEDAIGWSDILDIANELSAERLLKSINEIKPDLIISVHAFITSMCSQLKLRGKIDIPLMAIVTDFMPHRSYVNERVDAYITATDDTAKMLAEDYNVDPSIIYPFGIPIFEKFLNNDLEKNEKTIKELGFSQDKLTVLLMAGSFGVTDILSIYEELVQIDVDYQMIIITGKNKRLYDAFKKELDKNITDFEIYSLPKPIRELGENNIIRLLFEQSDDYKKAKAKMHAKGTVCSKPTKLFYFIDNVEDYMHISDLIITKPGGLTSSEAIACNLPMAIFKAYPGQEEENAEFLTKRKIAVLLKDGKLGAKQIEHILKYPKRLMTMKEACRKIDTGNSCAKIYELAKEMTKK